MKNNNFNSCPQDIIKGYDRYIVYLEDMCNRYIKQINELRDEIIKLKETAVLHNEQEREEKKSKSKLL